MSHQADDLNITVVGPDDAPATMPMNIPVRMFAKHDQGFDHLFSTTPEHPSSDFSFPNPGSAHATDGSSSGGYSTPITPFSTFNLELNTFDTHLSPTHEGYGELVTPINQFSPTSLSPSLNGLSLNDTYPSDTGSLFNSNTLASKDVQQYGYSPVQDPTAFSPGHRTQLQVTIPPPVGTPGTIEYTSDIFNLNFESNGGLDNLLSPDSQALNTPFDVMSLNQYPSPLAENGSDMQRPSRMHNRGLSVAGTSWTAAATPSSTLTSPSLSFTPSTDFQNTGSHLGPPSPYLSDNGDFDFTLGGEATVQRRHSHTGHGRSPSRGDRGRPHSRNGTVPSASSSRRSSPYPSPRPSGSPSDTLSPHQLWDSNHLAVPTADALDAVGGSSISRRHSFSAYRSGGMPHRQGHQHNGSLSANDIVPYHEESTSPGGSVRKVASSAGIKASEARRTKEARFACDICSQTFTTNHNLKNHKNVHFGVKEHACGSCNRMFTTQSVLARHLKTCKIANAANASS